MATLVMLLALGAGVVVWQLAFDDDRSELELAVAMAPDDAARFSWTDWAGVRSELGLDLDATSSPEDVQRLLDLGFEADLTSTTALRESTLVMHDQLGFSAASIDWELFSQGASGASVLMGAGDVDLDAVADRLRALGYEEPGSETGPWISDSEVDAITAEVTPELTFIVLDADAGLIVSSDSQRGIDAAVEAADADESAQLSDGVLAAVEGALTAALYTGDTACGELAMGNADPTEQAEGEALVAQAGDINPVTGFAIAAVPGGEVRVALSFESAEQARTNADTRAVLASGPAPGQGGDFADRFTLGDVTADDNVVTLELEPVEGSYVLSDLSTGPVLFATC
ncbi:MAG: hypothetical protein WB767_13395 [Nocardioides sp.]